jgi:hypothetical protein
MWAPKPAERAEARSKEQVRPRKMKMKEFKNTMSAAV